MDPQLLNAFIEKLTKSQFSDLKGSWANLHLELSEKLLNDAMLLLRSMPAVKKEPMMGLLQAIQVKGQLSVDLKLQV